ncbi:hypothetical protein SDC9_95692 [bioreactor metagenome]|uniref:Uncharacterized protein n=1 Tax=bioreactor metagenome TaxID=1076179 RepID=A0A645A704_9ZZZZ
MPQDNLHELAGVLVPKRDVHVLSAEHVGGPNQHGIAELVCGGNRLLLRIDSAPARALDVKRLQQRVEARAILRHVDAVRRGTEDANAVCHERARELNRRLPAERNDHAVGLLRCNHVHHVFRRERFKVEPVGGVKVRGDRLWVVVDDDDLVARLLERPDAVHGGIVKLNTLADANRPRAEDDHPFLASVMLL